MTSTMIDVVHNQRVLSARIIRVHKDIKVALIDTTGFVGYGYQVMFAYTDPPLADILIIKHLEPDELQRVVQAYFLLRKQS